MSELEALKVLVVEDDADTSTMLALFLDSRGHRSFVARDADAALAAVRTHAPDVALIDIGLPLKSGHELAAEIRRTFGSTIRLIATTGYGAEEDRRRARAAGFDTLILKPMDLEEVLRAVSERSREPG